MSLTVLVVVVASGTACLFGYYGAYNLFRAMFPASGQGGGMRTASAVFAALLSGGLCGSVVAFLLSLLLPLPAGALGTAAATAVVLGVFAGLAGMVAAQGGEGPPGAK